MGLELWFSGKEGDISLGFSIRVGGFIVILWS